MNGVFLSYRRDDVQGWAGRLSDSIKQNFGDAPLFFDRESIRPGDDFAATIDGAVGSCAMLLALIGRRWLDARDGAGRRRLDDPNDFVRLEIATALRRGIRVIPVLLGGAAIPAPDALPADLQALARKQAHELSDSRWQYDAEVLMKVLEQSLGPRRPSAEAEGAMIDVAEGLVLEAGAGRRCCRNQVRGTGHGTRRHSESRKARRFLARRSGTSWGSSSSRRARPRSLPSPK